MWSESQMVQRCVPNIICCRSQTNMQCLQCTDHFSVLRIIIRISDNLPRLVRNRAPDQLRRWLLNQMHRALNYHLSGALLQSTRQRSVNVHQSTSNTSEKTSISVLTNTSLLTPLLEQAVQHCSNLCQPLLEQAVQHSFWGRFSPELEQTVQHCSGGIHALLGHSAILPVGTVGLWLLSKGSGIQSSDKPSGRACVSCKRLRNAHQTGLSKQAVQHYCPQGLHAVRNCCSVCRELVP